MYILFLASGYNKNLLGLVVRTICFIVNKEMKISEYKSASCTKLPEIMCNTIFTACNLLCNFLDIFICYLYGCIASFLYKNFIIFNILAPARNKNICPLLVQVWITSSITLFSLPNLSSRITSLMAPKSRIYQGLRSKLYAGWTTASLLCHRKFNNSPLFKTHITIPRHFEKTVRVREKKIFFRDAASPRGLFKN